MTVSVITATYNSAATIGDCIGSVAGQHYPEIEHIIKDGGSNDGTLELIHAQVTDAARVISEPDQGIYDALNHAISVASGDVIGLLHSDDIYADKGVIDRVMEVFRDDAVHGVYGDLQYVNPHTKRVVRNWRSGEFSPGKLQKGWMPPHPTLFLRRKVYEEFGPFDLSFRIAADYDFMLRILKDGRTRLVYVPEVLIRMHTGGTSNRSLVNILRKSSEDYKALKKNKLRFPTLVLLRKNLSKIPQFFR